MYVEFYFASRDEICKQLESKLEINIKNVPVNNPFEYLCISLLVKLTQTIAKMGI